MKVAVVSLILPHKPPDTCPSTQFSSPAAGARCPCTANDSSSSFAHSAVTANTGVSPGSSQSMLLTLIAPTSPLAESTACAPSPISDLTPALLIDDHLALLPLRDRQ